MTAGADVSREPLLLSSMGSAARWVGVIVALVTFLAVAGIVGAATSLRTLRDWPARLSGSATVAVTGAGIESSDSAAARAVELLGRDSRIVRAWVVEPAPGDSLAARIIGAPTPDADSGAPRLVGLDARPGSGLTAADVLSILAGARIGAAVDDHGAWTGPLERLAAAAVGGAAVALMVLAATTSALAGWGARRALARARPQVMLLLQLGAREEAILKGVRGALDRAVVLGVIGGALLALGAASILVWSPEVASRMIALGLPLPPLEPLDLAAGAAWPLLALLIGMWSTGAAARGALRSLA